MMNEIRSPQTLAQIFNARSIALVGASDDPKKFGYMTLRSLIAGGFEGPIYPVNAKGGEIMGLKVYPSLRDVHIDDLVAIIVPAKFVPGILTTRRKRSQGSRCSQRRFSRGGKTRFGRRLSPLPGKKGSGSSGRISRGSIICPTNFAPCSSR